MLSHTLVPVPATDLPAPAPVARPPHRRRVCLQYSSQEQSALARELFVAQALLAACLWIAIKFEATRPTTPDSRIMSRITGKGLPLVGGPACMPDSLAILCLQLVCPGEGEDCSLVRACAWRHAALVPMTPAPVWLAALQARPPPSCATWSARRRRCCAGTLWTRPER